MISKLLVRMSDAYVYPYIILKQLVVTDFKLRYQSSALGYVWSLLRPLALFLILYIVFVKFLKVGDAVPHYGVYLLLGIVLWSFFVEVTVGSVGAIVGKGDLLRKVNFPKYVIVLAGSVSALINLTLNLGVVLIFALISNVEFTYRVLFAPIILAELFVFSFAIGTILAATFVRFRDINYIWEVVMQGAFYATPILYPLSLVPIDVAKILLLNPMAQMIQDLRYLLITPETTTIASAYDDRYVRIIPVSIVLFSLIVAIAYFRRRSPYFAEEV